MFQIYCQRVNTVTAFSSNNTHQIPIPWFVITTTCQHSSTVLYPCTPPPPPFTHCLVYLPVAPVFLCPFSTAPVFPRLHAPLFPLDSLEKEKDIILVRPIWWALDEQICIASITEPTQLGSPEGKTYMPTSLRTTLLGSLHASPGSGHPGSQHTFSLLQARYWWPSMAQDVSQYIRECSVCTISKTPHHLPAWELVPLPIPRHPCSHVRVDFVTDLAKSEGNTYILVVVYRFSKACKLIPLWGLPTALETVEALFHNLFRTFGIPEDVVSDCGPQFVSRVWKVFFKLLDVTVSLSSGYHPQTNGQTERKIQEIGRYLRAYCHDNQHC